MGTRRVRKKGRVKYGRRGQMIENEEEKNEKGRNGVRERGKE